MGEGSGPDKEFALGSEEEGSAAFVPRDHEADELRKRQGEELAEKNQAIFRFKQDNGVAFLESERGNIVMRDDELLEKPIGQPVRFTETMARA